MAELADAGAVGFTDDGLPVSWPGCSARRFSTAALQGVLALHEEDPSLSAGGVMHEGAVSALLGLAGIPSVSESTMIARDTALAGYEGGGSIQHLSARESVIAVEQARAAGVEVTAEGHSAPSALTDDAVRALDTGFKMNPPLRADDDRLALIDALRSGAIDCVATDRPALARGEGAAVRAGADGRHGPRDRLRRPPHRPRAARAPRARPAGRAHEARAPPSSASTHLRCKSGRPQTSAWPICSRSGMWARPATRVAPPTAASPAARSRGGSA